MKAISVAHVRASGVEVHPVNSLYLAYLNAMSAVMIPNAKTKALMLIIREKVAPDSIVYSAWL